MAIGASRHIFGGTLNNNGAASPTPFWTHVYYVICHLYHVQIVLDNNDSVASIYQLIHHFHQNSYVLEVETCGRLIEQIYGLASVSFREFGSQLNSLTLAAREGC